MCTKCDGFLERRRVNSPYEYRDLVSQIVATGEEGTINYSVFDGTPSRLPGCPACEPNLLHLSGNVGGVKLFLSTLRQALIA